MNLKAIRVLGEAELMVAPDLAVISLELRAEEKSPSKSRAQLDQHLKTCERG